MRLIGVLCMLVSQNWRIYGWCCDVYVCRFLHLSVRHLNLHFYCFFFLWNPSTYPIPVRGPFRLLRRSIKLRLEALGQEGKQIKTLLKRKNLDTTTRDGDIVQGVPKLAVSQMMKHIQTRLSKEECTDAECSYNMIATPTIPSNDIAIGYRFSFDNSGRGVINNIGVRLQQIENMVVQLKSIENQSCSR